jgi:uncharacterized membrane protein YphA (DoxX/SURF4 family)
MNHMSTATNVGFQDQSIALPRWKSIASLVGAVLTAILFLAAGLFKIAIPFQVQTLFEQLLIPTAVSLPLVLLLGIAETTAGVLVLIPKYRKWGGLLATVLLVAFMIYIGARYNDLVGRDCSCFPWVKRAVDLNFFWEDGLMLLFSVLAMGFAPRFSALKTPIMVAVGVAVLSGASYGYNLMSQSGVDVPPTVTADGAPFNLRKDKVFLFFYDPTCSHCQEAAEHMATYKWKSDAKVVAIPLNDPQWAAGFLKDTKLAAKTPEVEQGKTLRKLFTFPNGPFGVALDNGRVKEQTAHFDAPEPETTLKRLGFVE